MQLPGKRITAAELKKFLEECHHCQDGWLYVAYGFEDGKYSVYRFPCECTIPGGKKWSQLDNPNLYTNLEPDYLATPKELPGYVFIHPSHKRGFEKILTQIRAKLQRMRASEQEIPF